MTAVEWLYNNLNLCFDKFDNGEYSYTEFINASKEVKEQAKQMEKQQIIEAVSFGDCRGRITTYLTDEQYYNETYGSKGSDEISKVAENTSFDNLPKVQNKDSFGEISDEEIEKGAENAWSDYEYEEGNLYSTTFKGGWKLAIKWYREQLKLKI